MWDPIQMQGAWESAWQMLVPFLSSPLEGLEWEVGEGCSVDQLPLLQKSKDGDCVTAGNSPGGHHQILY